MGEMLCRLGRGLSRGVLLPPKKFLKKMDGAWIQNGSMFSLPSLKQLFFDSICLLKTGYILHVNALFFIEAF